MFVQIAQKTSVASNSNTTATWSTLGAGQLHQWYVTVSDGTSTITGPTWTFRTTASADPVFVGVGDIAACTNTNDTDTGNVISGVDGNIFTVGDNVYPDGTAADFTNCYAPTPWGSSAIKSRTRPIPGNHDWNTGNLNGYTGYFGANATDANGKSYYSYNIAGSNWHVVNLDSECALVPGGCAAGSPQEIWLKADLQANLSKNVIALFHKPRFSSAGTNLTDLQAFVDDMYTARVDIAMDGHDHVYERIAQLNATGTPDPGRGIRYFTVGMGGDSHQGFGTPIAGSEVRDASSYGILKLTLHATTYDWKYLPVAGSTFTDSGTASVVAAGVNQAPVAVADSYSTPLNTAKVVAAPGVLANDTDADGNPLTAILNANVTHGSLSLAANGGFTYTPTSGYTGPDSFTYHANDGTLNSNTVTVSLTVGGAVTNQALQLNGSSQYATLGSTSQLRSATFTVELWFKRTGAGVGTNTGTGGIPDAIPLITKGRAEGETPAADINYFLGIDASSGQLVADFEEGAGGASPSLNHPITAATVVTLNVWHHAAATYDGSTWNLYLDGVLDGTLAVGVTHPANAATAVLTTVGTADNTAGVVDGFFAGVVDEARIWSVARTATQINATRNVQVTTAQTNLLGVWNMNEGSGTTLADNSGNGITGTAVGAPTWVAGFPLSGNQAPVAVADSYSTPLNTAKVVAAPGVLANDTDADGNPLTAILNANVTHGSLSLAANGGFTYTPTSGYTGPDSFTYHANDGTLNSNTVTVSLTVGGAVTNQALQLNGSSQYATLGSTSQLRSATFTVELWFKRTGAGVGTNTGTGGIPDAIPLITKGRAEGETPAADINYFLGIDASSGQLVADFEEGAGGASPSLNHPITAATVVTLNVWHHAAATYDGSTWNLYLDGVLDGTLAVGVTHPANAATAVLTTVGTADNTAGVVDGFFAGVVDEARIWSVARTATQINATRNVQVTTAQTNLLGVWNMNEGSGTTLADNSGNGITGTAVGAPTWVAGFPLSAAAPVSYPAVIRNSVWYLRDSNTSAPGTITSFAYGNPTDTPIFGDWNNDGVATPGVVRVTGGSLTWYLRNTNSAGAPDTIFAWGAATDKPLVGDWDGNGTDTPGLLRASNHWILSNSGDGTSGIVDFFWGSGAANEKPIVGDWDGNGSDTPGLVRAGNWWILKTSNDASSTVTDFFWGTTSETAWVVGDWNGDGSDNPGILRGNWWLLRDSNTGGGATDRDFFFGLNSDTFRVWAQ